MPFPFETNRGRESGGPGFLEHRDRPFARDERLVVGADDDARALAERIGNERLRRGGQRRRNGRRIANRLRRHPVLAVRAVQIAAEHAEAVGQRAGMRVEERLFLDRIALDSADVTPRHHQPAALVEAHLADADARLREADSSGRMRSSAAARRAAPRRARPRASRAQGCQRATA